MDLTFANTPDGTRYAVLGEHVVAIATPPTINCRLCGRTGSCDDEWDVRLFNLKEFVGESFHECRNEKDLTWIVRKFIQDEDELSLLMEQK